MLNIPPPSPAGSKIVRASSIQIELPARPVRYYRHGWQSWSLAAWTDLECLPVQKPAILHPLQVDAGHALDPNPNGSWLGAVEFEDGKILLLGALGLDSHVSLEGNTLIGQCEGGEIEWFTACGDEKTVFGEYAAQLASRLGCSMPAAGPRVWCSWYSLYTAIEEGQLNLAFEGLGDLPFDVLQVDDGWQAAVGDWEANEKFPSGMAALADRIKSTGRRAGLWLAPLIAVKSSRLFRQHPDWFLRGDQDELISAGHNWGEPLYALDTTHPEVCAWLEALMRQVRAWGFDYIKLDFLYAGALKGQRRENLPREAAYRQALQRLRTAMGEDAYFLSCGTPILPALGLCDAMRTGPDVAGDWEGFRDARLFNNPTAPSAKNAVRTVLHRLWLSPLVRNDPDVAYFTSRGNRLNPEEKAALQNLAQITGFRATSDLPQWMSAKERQAVHSFLTASPKIEQTGRYRFSIDGREVDFSAAVPLPPAPTGLTGVWAEIIGGLAEWRFAHRINYLVEKFKLQRRLRGV